jgi:hypothetical protein
MDMGHSIRSLRLTWVLTYSLGTRQAHASGKACLVRHKLRALIACARSLQIH